MADENLGTTPSKVEKLKERMRNKQGLASPNDPVKSSVLGAPPPPTTVKHQTAPPNSISTRDGIGHVFFSRSMPEQDCLDRLSRSAPSILGRGENGELRT